MCGSNNERGNVVKKIVWNKIVCNDSTIKDKIIKNGLIIIGNNNTITGCKVSAKKIGIQAICVDGSVLQDFVENEYESASDVLQNLNIENFLTQDQDIISLFTTWAFSQPNIFDRFLKCLIVN